MADQTTTNAAFEELGSSAPFTSASKVLAAVAAIVGISGGGGGGADAPSAYT